MTCFLIFVLTEHLVYNILYVAVSHPPPPALCGIFSYLTAEHSRAEHSTGTQADYTNSAKNNITVYSTIAIWY